MGSQHGGDEQLERTEMMLIGDDSANVVHSCSCSVACDSSFTRGRNDGKMWSNEQTLMLSTHFLFLLQQTCTDANVETRGVHVTQRQQENRLSGAAPAPVRV
ncbi:uncharacterized protein V6R79_012843 [Siganus canaliculatus]